MMPVSQKAIRILIGVLVAQVLLAALLLMPRTQDADPLVTYEFAEVDRIRISGDEEDAIDLSRAGDAWSMPDGLPVDASRIESLTEVLGSDRWSWPVASTSDAARRFEVTEENFQRRIELLASEGAEDAEDNPSEVATLYLGTSPGFRRIHAREAGSEKIYSIELATYDLPLDQDDWLDKSLIEAPASVDSIARSGLWKVELDGEGEWSLPNSPLQAKGSDISSLATRFETLRVMGLAEKTPDRAPDLEFEISAAGVQVRYAFYRPPEESSEDADDENNIDDDSEQPEFSTSIKDTLVKSSLRDEYFKVSSFTVDQLDKTLEDLTDAPAEDQDEASQEVQEVEEELSARYQG